jgi:hypothetical protein
MFLPLSLSLSLSFSLSLCASCVFPPRPLFSLSSFLATRFIFLFSSRSYLLFGFVFCTPSCLVFCCFGVAVTDNSHQHVQQLPAAQLSIASRAAQALLLLALQATCTCTCFAPVDPLLESRLDLQRYAMETTKTRGVERGDRASVRSDACTAQHRYFGRRNEAMICFHTSIRSSVRFHGYTAPLATPPSSTCHVRTVLVQLSIFLVSVSELYCPSSFFLVAGS